MLPVSPDCPLLIAPLVCLRSVSCGPNVASVSELFIIDNTETLATLGPQDTEDKPKGQSIMDNPKTLATLGPQDTEDKPKGQSIMDNPETLATLGPQGVVSITY
jgi:hypothetical protein